jgi:hypothetical protein
MNLYSLSLLGCATCVENSKNDTTDAAGWAIFLMLCVILPLLGTVIFFIVRMARRAAAALEPEFRDVEGPAIARSAPAKPLAAG